MRRSTDLILATASTAVIVLALGACNKGKSNATTGSTTSSGGAVATTAESEPMHQFTGDKNAAIAGRKIFLSENCYGCHGGLAGGAMGPSLRDTVWKYGGTDSTIYASIHDGRPLGMPAWGKMLSDQQIKELIAYIHSLRTPAEPKNFWFTPADSAITRNVEKTTAD